MAMASGNIGLIKPYVFEPEISWYAQRKQGDCMANFVR